MPETKITWQRLRDHFRRRWIAYIAGAVALLFLNNLVYTVTRPRASEDETLKLMLLNTDLELPEADLLAQAAQLGFKAVEVEPLSISEDASGEMLLAVQLMGGYGDIYIADAAGYRLLLARDACMEGGVRAMDHGIWLAAAANAGNPQAVLDALEVVYECIAGMEANSF